MDPAAKSGHHSGRGARLFVEVAIALVAAMLLYFACRTDARWVELHSEGMRCLRSEKALHMWRFLRFVAVATSLVLVFLVRPRLARFAERRPDFFGDVARVALAIVMALAVSEVILRKPWHHEPPGPPGECVFCPPNYQEPTLGWRLTPSKTMTWDTGFAKVLYVSDAEGNRVRGTDVKRDHDRPTILITGESVAYGMALSYDESFAGQLEDDTGLQVVNVSVFGYGMDQAYLRMREIAPLYSHLVGIVTVFVPQEAERFDIEDRDHLALDSHGNLHLVPPTPKWLRDMHVRDIWRGISHSEDAIDVMRAIARASAAYAKERGAALVFVTTNYDAPCLAIDGKKPALFERIFDEQGLPSENVPVPAGDHIVGDPHPSPAAHRRIADAVEKALRNAHAL